MGNNDPTNEIIKDNNPITDEIESKGYTLSGKIMLTTIVVLFFIVLLMLFLHLYARWYLIRARRRAIRREIRRRRTQYEFIYDSITRSTAVPAIPSGGLDAAVIARLPAFTYDPKTRLDNPPECAVCLSEFEAGETGRVLPKCNHAFHTDCIDMWFHSHATCPLCRAPVEPATEAETRPDVVVTVCEPETGSSSGFGAEEEDQTGTGSLRKLSSVVGVTVEIPARSDECFRDELSRDSPSSTQSSFRSPIGRMLSFKRILSRERKGSVSPSSGCGGGFSSASELSNAERGETQ